LHQLFRIHCARRHNGRAAEAALPFVFVMRHQAD
jgi:hypothetical protein